MNEPKVKNTLVKAITDRMDNIARQANGLADACTLWTPDEQFYSKLDERMANFNGVVDPDTFWHIYSPEFLRVT